MFKNKNKKYHECLKEALNEGLIHRYSEKKDIGFCEGRFTTTLDAKNMYLNKQCRKCIFHRDNIDISKPTMILSTNYISSIDSGVPVVGGSEVEAMLRVNPKEAKKSEL